MCSPVYKDGLEGYTFEEILELERKLKAYSLALSAAKEVIKELKMDLRDMTARKEFFAEALDKSLEQYEELEKS